MGKTQTSSRLFVQSSTVPLPREHLSAQRREPRLASVHLRHELQLGVAVVGVVPALVSQRAADVAVAFAVIFATRQSFYFRSGVRLRRRAHASTISRRASLSAPLSAPRACLLILANASFAAALAMALDRTRRLRGVEGACAAERRSPPTLGVVGLARLRRHSDESRGTRPLFSHAKPHVVHVGCVHTRGCKTQALGVHRHSRVALKRANGASVFRRVVLGACFAIVVAVYLRGGGSNWSAMRSSASLGTMSFLSLDSLRLCAWATEMETKSCACAARAERPRWHC